MNEPQVGRWYTTKRDFSIRTPEGRYRWLKAGTRLQFDGLFGPYTTDGGFTDEKGNHISFSAFETMEILHEGES